MLYQNYNNPKSQLHIMHFYVFDTAEYGGEVKILNFSMADPIWRPKLEKLNIYEIFY